jgi:hypothetical protein
MMKKGREGRDESVRDEKLPTDEVQHGTGSLDQDVLIFRQGNF